MWQGIKNWWNNDVSKFLTLDYWKEKGKSISDGFLGGLKKAWDTVVTWATGVVDWFISLFNGASRSVEGLKNSSVKSGSTKGASTNPRSATEGSYYNLPSIPKVSIPRLAQGAVIPPNREFMAVLGDQQRGYNLEAPEDLIRKIVREESGGGNEQIVMILQALLEAVRGGHVIMVDKAVFGRTAKESLDDITIKSGKFALKF